MFRLPLTLGVLLATGAAALGGADDAAADRVTMRDGSVIRGAIISPHATHGMVEIVVRRGWAEQHAKTHLKHWDRLGSTAVHRAIEQRRTRLEAWKKERQQAQGVGADDRILRWIDRELARLADPARAAHTPLLAVRIPRSEIGEVHRGPAGAARRLMLAWQAGLADPESLTAAELADALQARGFAADGGEPDRPISLEGLLPPASEPDALWLGRRAATEIAVDDGLRFLRYQGMVMPEAQGGVPFAGAGIDPSMVMGELKRLLDPAAAAADANRPDPVHEKLRTVAARGRSGAVVMALVIAPEFDGATIETTFWVRSAEGRWKVYGMRSTTVRAADLRPGEGNDLAQDPQVKKAIGLVEALGLGSVPAELKQRSLQVGAATQKALGLARAAFQRELDTVMLPVLQPDAGASADQANAGAGAGDKPAPAEAPRPGPRRSMLGPKDR